MTAIVPDILARIVQRKQAELRDASVPRSELEQRAANATPRDFAQALRRQQPAVIAEIKKASPSRGVLSQNFDPALIAAHYQQGGASALSVLTDRDFFQGSLADLEKAREAVALPVLRKDFTIADYQVVEAAAHGADAILLIAAILDASQMRAFRELAAQYRMAALVEVHDERELDIALESGAEIIGVNNRDLRTFDVHLQTSLRLAKHIPAHILKVSESGIFTAAHIHKLTAAGFQAFLVGESLMKSGDPAASLRALCS
ncbi:MAG: indole-3-glycerol phosphate synthase [Bryobacterales bacterium]|nr:indole-3-glycerol phosphate synthase [Bryobacterales bacterium]